MIKIDRYDRRVNVNNYNIIHWVKYWIALGDTRSGRKILCHFIDTDNHELREVTYIYDRIYHPTTHSVTTHKLR